MSEPKFTDGPWVADQPAAGFSAIRAGKKLVFALANPSRAHGDVDLSDEEKYANLALVEHAPELYAALESIISAWSTPVSTELAVKMINGRIAPAILALAKARGEA